MTIDEALNQASQEPSLRETLPVVGNIERDSASKVRVYPDPYDLSRYVIVDPQSVDGEVVDVTEHARAEDPSRRGPVYAVPVRKGAEIQIVSVKTITVTDVGRMRFLSLNQSGARRRDAGAAHHCCGGCGGHGDPIARLPIGCASASCTTVGGTTYSCTDTDPDTGLVYCSGCCLVVA